MRNNILVQKNSNPYYILAPSYTVQSAGVKALHLLCHHLNMKGYSAFLVNVRLYDGGRKYEIDPNLITPFLTDAICDLHIEKGLVPIVIYPDIVVGNPLNSNCVVRYLLHYAGFLGGQKNFPDNELVFCYTKKIANYANASDKNTLFMPICNTEVFYPPNDGSVRQGSCFYASKYLSHHKGKLFDITKNSVEIKRGGKAQTTKEVADLLRRSEYFVAYEDTSLITEAILCDCPVVLVENEFFDGRTLAEFELGLDGYANTNSEEDLDRARSGIEQGKKNFIDAVNNFWDQLEFFIEETQRFSKKRSKGEVSLDLMSASWMTNKYLKKNLKRYLSYKIKRILGKDKVK